MGLADLLLELEARGVRLTCPNGLRLVADPVALVTAELREAIAAHRAQVAALVKRAQSAGLAWPLDVAGPGELGFESSGQEVQITALHAGPVAAMGIELVVRTPSGEVVLSGADVDRLAAVARVFPLATVEGMHPCNRKAEAA